MKTKIRKKRKECENDEDIVENKLVIYICEDVASIFTHTDGLKKLRLFTSRILRNNPSDENKVILILII